ncbi:hypothetical protein ACF061_00960 [Streptomyces sp. NPDC015220]|uniref:hypothetical protein n=1 Tax=Streptomyces sp. NPDC015220 TaxID=3364947 RepID=UPI003700CFF2
MTDRPTLDDLDAEPERTHWCCNGNAEDCPLCTDPNPPYPFLCPGHPDTAESRQRVTAGAKAPEQAASWNRLEARAFNAVLPALRDAGEWLPLSARRKVANAVLAELKRELDALAEYENAINWMTTCTSCARVLDASIRELERAERAEAALAEALSGKRSATSRSGTEETGQPGQFGESGPAPADPALPGPGARQPAYDAGRERP